MEYLFSWTNSFIGTKVLSVDFSLTGTKVQRNEKARYQIINRTIVFRHPDIMLHLCKSLVRPHLEYFTAAWSPHYCKDKELIERVQRRFTRMIHDLKDLPYEHRLAKTWSLEDRRTRADLTEVYKIFHRLSTVRFSTFF